MRLAAILLALALIATPALADNPGSGDPVFGQAACTPTFKCPPSFDSESLRIIFPQILARAKSCIASRFSMRNAPDGYFEEGMGLDYELCLTSKTQPQAARGLTMVPKCCVSQMASDSTMCQVVCTKFGVR